MEMEGGNPVKKKKWVNPMHEIKPGVYRGHAPPDLSPEERAKLAERDKRAVRRADELVKNLNTPKREPVY
jgi:hypothetical protein